jgi:hypothetical protein
MVAAPCATAASQAEPCSSPEVRAHPRVKFFVIVLPAVQGLSGKFGHVHAPFENAIGPVPAGHHAPTVNVITVPSYVEPDGCLGVANMRSLQFTFTLPALCGSHGCTAYV